LSDLLFGILQHRSCYTACAFGFLLRFSQLNNKPYSYRKEMKKALSKSNRFDPPSTTKKLSEGAAPIISIGNMTGEGWFLTGEMEMAELIENGVPNIVCIQPFACLPNHIMGKGVIKE